MRGIVLKKNSSQVCGKWQLATVSRLFRDKDDLVQHPQLKYENTRFNEITSYACKEFIHNNRASNKTP